MLGAGRLWDEAKNVGALVAAAARRLAWPVYVAGDAAARTAMTAGAARVPRRRRSSAAARRWRTAWRAALDLRPAGALRAVRPLGARGGAAGCALVLGDIPSLREIWDDAALFVPPDDALRSCGAGDHRLIDAPPSCGGAARAARARASAATLRLTARRRDHGRASACYREARAERATPERRPTHAFRDLLPLAGVRLEPRQRPFPARRRRASCSRAATRCRSTSRATAGAGRTCCADHGTAPLAALRSAPIPTWPQPHLRADTLDLDAALDGADVVIVHEWNTAALVRRDRRAPARGAAVTGCSSTTRTTAR